MAKTTSKDLRGKVIYSMSIRNHTAEGTFTAAEADLDRIKALGADIILLLPVFTADGGLFAVKDGRTLSPEYGTLEDFKHFTEQIRALNMRVIMEIVFNHASKDSPLLSLHPDWFYRDERGHTASRTLNKPDVCDFDYENRELWDYQIGTLLQWAEYADGFSCNLASIIPLDFWQKARGVLDLEKPGLIWLADTLESGLIIEHRANGFQAQSDGEMFQVFDMCLNNQTRSTFEAYIKDEIHLSVYTKLLENQDAWFPDNYCKLYYLENYFTPRLKALIDDNAALRTWTAFIYCLKGATLIFEGQEYSYPLESSITAKDPIDWDSGPDLSILMKNLGRIKKDPIMSKGVFYITADDRTNTATVRYIMGERWLEGSFSLKGQSGLADTFVPDGMYLNLVDYSVVAVKNGKYGVDKNPVIFCSDYKQQAV